MNKFYIKHQDAIKYVRGYLVIPLIWALYLLGWGF